MDNPTQVMADAIKLIQTVAKLAAEREQGWETWGPPEDRVQLTTVHFRGDDYTLLRGNGAFMAFTPDEWSAFRAGARDGEFNADAGLPPAEEERSSR